MNVLFMSYTPIVMICHHKCVKRYHRVVKAFRGLEEATYSVKRLVAHQVLFTAQKNPSPNNYLTFLKRSFWLYLASLPAP